MNRFNELYTRTMSDKAFRAEVKKILGKTPVEDATDEQLNQLGELAKTVGIEISLEEAKEYLSKSTDDTDELSDGELQAVAGGGKNDQHCGA